MNHTGHGSHEGGGHHGSGDCPMEMVFYASTCVVEMFSAQEIKPLGPFMGYLVGIVFALVLYETLKYHRDVVFRHITESLEASEGTSFIAWPHLYQTVLHAIQLFCSYLFMLLFMTYNVWVCLAIVFGSGLGYFLFCWKKTEFTEKITDCCH